MRNKYDFEGITRNGFQLFEIEDLTSLLSNVEDQISFARLFLGSHFEFYFCTLFVKISNLREILVKQSLFKVEL